MNIAIPGKLVLALLVASVAFSDVPRGVLGRNPGSPAAGTTQATQPDELLTHASNAFNRIAQNAMPAVVAINSIRRARTTPFGLPGMGVSPLTPGMPDPGSPGLGGPGILPPDLEEWDNPNESGEAHHPDRPAGPKGHKGPAGPAGPKDPRLLGIGSGILIRSDGLILTNHHVVEDAERITVIFEEKHRVKAKLIGADPKTDLAVIKVEDPKRKDYPVIPFGNSDQIREGDWAIAIGSPFGLNRSVSFGIISAKGRVQMGIVDVEDFIQTDAAINPGSSGGPLLNARGELIGVNTAIFSQSGGNMGIGFAIPARIAKEISSELIAKGRIARGWVGMMAQDIDADLARYFRIPSSQGALVSEVLPHGPAGKAAVQSGDVVTQFDSHPVENASALKALVGRTKAGTTVPLEVVRDGKPRTISIAIQEQPGAKAPVPATQKAGQLETKPMPSFGLAVEDVPRDISKLLRLPARQGTLVVGVNPGSQAFDAGIGPGDIILSVDRRQVRGARDFARMAKVAQAANQEEVSLLYVQRGPVERIYVPIKLREPSA